MSQRKTKPKIPDKVNDLLTADDLNELLRNMDKEKPNITICLILYMDKDGMLRWKSTNDTPISLAVWMLESIKNELLNNGKEEDRE